jgi:5-methyltetrahydrofolate--homocysteine methyltransferase
VVRPAPDSKTERSQELEAALAERILVLDGAMGTAIQGRQLTAADFGGPELDGCNEVLVVSRPDVILDIHRGYLEAGADILETDTFGGTPLVLAEYGLADRARELNRVAAELARQAAAEFATADRPRFVAGSMGPTTKAITVTGGVTFDALIDHFRVQAAGLIEGGSDLLLVETQQDTRNVKAALLGIDLAVKELGRRVPIMVSGTIEPTGTMLAGQGIEAFYASVMHADLLSIGLNCATGPEFMTDHLRALAALAKTRVSCVPNAGLPDSEGRYLETAAGMARVLERFCDHDWLNLIGGCCGTTPEHIRAMVAMARSKRPRVPVTHERTIVSGIDFLEINDDNRPVLVGERTNVIGSRKFKRLVGEGRWEEASEVGRQQVKGGAAVVDVCLADPDRDELADIVAFLPHLIRKVKAPLMIDSTDARVLERALTWSQGKAIINSVNLEDGEERFEHVLPLARRYGAAVVCGTIDEDPESGMAVTRARKLEVARRSFHLMTEKYGIPGEDIIWDPLTFPCATGDAKYVGSAVETIEGLRLIKAEFPQTKTILGISNVSFGLPESGREVLNSVFLYHCTRAGLDLAIVNSEKLERYPSIPEAERKLAEDLIWNRGKDPIAAYAAHFRGAAPREKKNKASLPLDERLANYIVEGSKDGLIPDLELKRKEQGPLDIINGPLMKGMDEVGRLFNANELIVAEVLESAEAMKAAVGHLEQYMEKADTASRGKIILATVKGDVHDIGKNLVEIVLANNGYTVVNLGIKVPPEVLIAAVREHRPDVVGLSGLLVKSAQQMVVTAGDMHDAGIELPILVGGAALTNKFTRTRIAPAYESLVAYAKDAMTGLDLMGQLMDEGRRRDLSAALAAETAAATAVGKDGDGAAPAPRPAVRSRSVRADLPIPPVPDLDRHMIEPRLDEVWAYMNPQMLYGRHLGLRGDFDRLRAAKDPKALALEDAVEAVKAEARAGAIQVRAVWQFFEAESDGNTIRFYRGTGAPTPAAEITFPRQAREPGLCLADFVLPARGSNRDHVALFVTTAGAGIRERAEEAKQKGEYLRSHALQALALETAEAAAEWLHARLRNIWGFPDPPETTMRDRFRAHYRGKRYSFGYPACPELADQAVLWELLRPDEIGVGLTEGFMMDPEASVSALAFQHPDAIYFGVAGTEPAGPPTAPTDDERELAPTGDRPATRP